VLSVNSDVVRLFLHVLAATIWVGGQLTLAGLVPGLRALSPDAPRAAARRFNLIAWPAYVVLIVTGIWNVVVVQDRHYLDDTAYMVTLGVKIGVVVLSGVAAALHSISKTKVGLAVWGALTGLSALTALFFGMLLHLGT
jgi:putative copper export protein